MGSKVTTFWNIDRTVKSTWSSWDGSSWVTSLQFNMTQWNLETRTSPYSLLGVASSVYHIGNTLCPISIQFRLGIFWSSWVVLILIPHSCMPSPLAPDPIRVQSCACCLFWTNRNSMAVHLYFYLTHSIQLEINLYIGAISKWKYLLLLKL